mmetsp:Transcript_13757/g.24452  ORF Transcript_13757/g.24452 Transcript_13757/m.24452 type:complete len:180 (+) Transcript_13757:3-542(+)
MKYLTMSFMVFFPLLQIIDLFFDGFFYTTVKDNSNSLLRTDEANVIQAIIFVFFVLGCIACLINTGIFIFHFFRQRKLASEESDTKLPLQLSPFLTWLEDLPQTILCLFIAFKLDSFIGEDVQLGKAIFTICKSMLFLVYFRMSDMWKNKKTIFIIADCIGYIIIFLCSIVLLGRLGTF